MRNSFSVKNENDQIIYIVSIVHVQKRFTTPPISKEVNFGIINYDNIIFEAAIYKKKASFKPFFIIELDDTARKGISEHEFTSLIKNVITKEKIENLIDEKKCDEIFEKYGFLSNFQYIWSLFVFSKIKVIFLMKDPYKDAEDDLLKNLLKKAR